MIGKKLAELKFKRQLEQTKEVKLCNAEHGIRGTIIHRLAHDAAELKIDPYIQKASYAELAEAHIELARVVLLEHFKLDPVQVVRIMDAHELWASEDSIHNKAAKEYDMFRMLRRFSGDGGSACNLEHVLEWQIEQLRAEKESAAAKQGD